MRLFKKKLLNQHKRVRNALQNAKKENSFFELDKPEFWDIKELYKDGFYWDYRVTFLDGETSLTRNGWTPEVAIAELSRACRKWYYKNHVKKGK